jgi:putative phosphoribosyl transferase
MNTVTSVQVPVGIEWLEGDLAMVDRPSGVVLFAHGSGSSRHSPRNQSVAGILQTGGFTTLLIDLLTAAEEDADRRTAEFRFDLEMLAQRLVAIVDWLGGRDDVGALPIGLFGASTGAGAALMAAAARPGAVAAVVSRGGRPDLAGSSLKMVTAPTLLIVGSRDTPVIPLNESAMREMRGQVELRIVSGASHLFEEPGKLEDVAALASEWFTRHLRPYEALRP